jgi:hypothetical protein
VESAQEKWFCMSIKNPVHFSGLYGMRFIENLEIYFSKGVPDTVLPEFLARIRKLTSLEIRFEEKLAWRDFGGLMNRIVIGYECSLKRLEMDGFVMFEVLKNRELGFAISNLQLTDDQFGSL